MQGFQRAAELAPRRPDPAVVLASWRPLAASAAAAAGLAEQLGGTAAALRLERVDVALSASDALQRMRDVAEGCWAAAAKPTAASGAGQQGEQGAMALAAAFAALSEAQAAAVQQLAADHHQQLVQEEQEDVAAEPFPEEEAGALLAAVERLVLGYASTAVALRDTTSEEFFLAPDGGNLLAWLSAAVQAVDRLSTGSAELQLLLPPLLALLCTPATAAQVSDAVAAAAEQLEEEEEGEAQEEEETGTATAGAAGGKEEQEQGQEQLRVPSRMWQEERAAAAMQPLLAAAGQHAAFAGLLQGLQQVQAAAQLLTAGEERRPLAQQQLALAGAVVSTWQELEDAMEEAAAAESSTEEVVAAAGTGDGAPWQQCSAVLGEAVAAEVAHRLLPPLAAALGSTSATLRAAAPSLARRSGLVSPEPAPLPILPGSSPAHAPPAPQPAGADLVPFTDFDDGELPGAGMLLGGLLTEELEPAGRGGGGLQLAARQPGGAAEAALVPFLDFDEDLAGAGGLQAFILFSALHLPTAHTGHAWTGVFPGPRARRRTLHVRCFPISPTNLPCR